MPVATLSARFWAKVEKTDSCWLWIGARIDGGYGCIRAEGRTQKAHRVAWTLTRGPIPAGVDVLHHCDNPPCVRDDHLWLGGDHENCQDKIAKGRDRSAAAKYRGRTHCDQGHALSGDNLRITSRGARKCRACGRVQSLARYHRTKGRSP